MLQDSAELYLWTVIKEKNIPAREEAGFIAHIKDLQKSRIEVPGAAKLTELNKARINFKHYGNLPAREDVIKCQGYVNDFLRQAMPIHFGVEFDTLSVADLISDKEVREEVKAAESELTKHDAKTAAEHIGKAKYLVFAKLDAFIPQLDRTVERADDVISSLGAGHFRVFEYLTTYLRALREVSLLAILRLSMDDYRLLRTRLPTVQRAISGKWYTAHTRHEYAESDCKRAIACICDLATELQHLMGSQGSDRTTASRSR